MLILKLAFRNILRQKRRSLLTGLTMTGGYMLFVFGFSLLNGSYNNIIEFFTLDSTGHIQIHKDDFLDKPKIYKTLQNRSTIETALEQNRDVIGFAPRVFSPALAYAADKTSPASVVGVDVDIEPTVSRLMEKVTAGRYFRAAVDKDGYHEAMIGYGLSVALDLNVGDEIVLISQGADGSIANDIYLISAVIGTRSSLDRMAVYLPLGAAQSFLSMGSDVHQYAIRIGNMERSRRVAKNIAAALPDVTVSPWQEVQSTFYKTMQADKQGNNFMMGLVVFIVFIGVLNTVLMSVLERTREFGVLKAIGCRPFELMRLITLETLMLAGISIGIGLVLIVPVVAWFTQVGFLLPEAIEMGGIEIQHMRGRFAPDVFLIPMAFMLVTAVIISLPPGFRAARLLPKEALGSH